MARFDVGSCDAYLISMNSCTPGLHIVSYMYFPFDFTDVCVYNCAIPWLLPTFISITSNPNNLNANCIGKRLYFSTIHYVLVINNTSCLSKTV